MQDFETDPALQPEASYKFHDFQPNEEEPVSKEAFDDLGDTIELINIELGVEDNDGTHAYSKGKSYQPDMGLTRFSGPNGRRALTIGIIGPRIEAFVTARNYCGPPANPRQPAAIMTVTDKERPLISDTIRSITDSEFRIFTRIVKTRDGQKSFERRKSDRTISGQVIEAA